MKKRLAIVISLLIATIILIGVALEAQTSRIPAPRKIEGTVINKRPVNWDKGKMGGDLLLAVFNAEPATFNASQSSETSSSIYIDRFLIRLFELDEDRGYWRVFPGDYAKGTEIEGPKGKMKAGYDMKVDGEKQILTIYLSKEVYYNDGTRMKADDWVYFWNEIMCDENIGHPSYNSTLVRMVSGDEKQIKAEKIDDFTFKMVYPRVLGEPELQAVYQAMPKHIVEPIKKAKGAEGITQLWGISTPAKELIGNGPWILKKYDLSNQSAEFAKNPKFFLKDEWNNRVPYLNRVLYTNAADFNTQLLKFKNKESDYLPVQSKDFKTIMEDSQKLGYDVWNGGPTSSIDFLLFNQNPESVALKGKPCYKWFSKKEFRQAMNYLVDRESLVQKVLNGLGEPDVSYFTKSSPYFDPAAQFDSEYNPEKAEKLLEKINIRDRDGNGIKEDNDGNEIKFIFMTNAGNTRRETTINLLAQDWKAYGIHATPSPMEFNVLIERLDNAPYDWQAMIMGLTGGLFPFEGENVYKSNGNLHMWYPYQDKPATDWEKKVDDLFDKAKFEPDFAKRRQYVTQMFQTMYDNYPMMPLIRRYSFLAAYKKLGNVNWDPWMSETGYDDAVGGEQNIRLYNKN